MKQRRHILLISIILASLISLFPFGTATRAEGPIEFRNSSLENHFPDELIFRATVSSSAGDITKATLVYTSESRYGSESFSKIDLDFEPAAEVNLEYAWDTTTLTLPPSAPIRFYWIVADSAGNQVQTKEVTYRYDDTRYNWKIRANENVSVWWHEKPDNFGQEVFEIANQAIEEQYPLFQSALDYQIYIIIYNNFEEFAAWHTVTHGWVGGEAFTNYGITTQIVTGNYAQESWLNGVVPHEISHLYFEQVTHNPTTSIPVWLNEGLAQYNEFIAHTQELALVDNAVSDQELVPLSSLANGFGSYDEDRVRLSYAESLSAVTYFVETHGKDALGDLLAAYHGGASTDEALLEVIGQDMNGFETSWADWLGVPAGEYLIPTARALPTFRPSPTMMTFSTPDPNRPTPTPAPTSTPKPPVSPSPRPPAATPEGNDSSENPRPVFKLPCLAPLSVLLMGVGGVFYAKRKTV